MPDRDDVFVRTNLRLTELRRWLAHDHRDEAFWIARAITAPDAQRERTRLRVIAHAHHVERATAHGRIHCARFVSLDEQRAWLEAARAKGTL